MHLNVRKGGWIYLNRERVPSPQVTEQPDQGVQDETTGGAVNRTKIQGFVMEGVSESVSE